MKNQVKQMQRLIDTSLAWQNEILFETTPAKADKIIKIFNERG